MMTPSEQMEWLLLTVPEVLHGDIMNLANDVGIIKTVIEEVIPQWTEEQQVEALDQVEKNEGVYKTVLVDIFKMNETKDVNDSHRNFIKKVFCRFKTCFENLSEELIVKHDLSKYWLVVFSIYSRFGNSIYSF